MTSFLVDCAIKVSIVMAVALIAVRVLRDHSAAIRHGVLSVGLLCAALMPSFNLVLPPLEVKLAGSITADLPERVLGKAPDYFEFPFDTSASVLPTEFTKSSAEVPATIPPVSSRIYTWSQASLWIWLAGVVVCFAILFAGIVRLAWIGYKSEPMESENWLRAAQRISREYGLRGSLRLLRSRKSSILATWGFLKPDVILPGDSSEWSSDRIDIVLAHEFAHVRRSDWLIQMLASTVRAIYWFNPLVWMVCRRLERECEQSCDDAVLRRGVSGTQYAAHLLELVKTFKWKNRNWTPALSMAGRSTLERRFRAMLTPGLNRSGGSNRSVAITLVAFLVLTIPIAALRASAQTSGASSTTSSAMAAAQASVLQTATRTVSINLLAAVAALAGQNAPLQPGMASMDGAVVRVDTGAPVAGATVELQLNRGGPGRNTYETTTDGEGKFAFPAIAPDKYRVVVSSYTAGFVATAYGKNVTNPRGTELPVVAGQRLRDLKIAMTPTGSITGRVVDGDGEPVARAQVQALRLAYRDGKKVLQIIQAGPANDLGEYRLFWLPPGTYFINAKPERLEQRGSTSYVVLPGIEQRFTTITDPTIVRRPLEGGGIAEDVYVPVYFPGAVDLRNARAIELRPGQDMGGTIIDVSAGRLPGRHIRGTVIDAATGRPAPYTQVNVISPNPSDISFVPNAMTDSNGRFDVRGVVAGPHYLSAKLYVPSPTGSTRVDQKSYPGFLPIEVNASDVEDIRIVVGPSITLNGLLTVSGRASVPNDPELARIRVVSIHDPGSDAIVEPAVDPARPTGQVIDGAFSLSISPGRYRFGITGLPPNMYLKSLRLDSIDLLNDPVLLTSSPQGQIEVVVGTDVGSLEGKALNAGRTPAAGATVVLVPDASRRQRFDLYKVMNSDASGKFEFQGIEPGSYKVFAWEDVDPGIWADSDFMQSQEIRGRAIQVNSGLNAATEVTVISR